MHAIRHELLELQAQRLGLPLLTIDLPHPCSNEEYEARMQRAVERALQEGITRIAFGDLFLEDIRAYREQRLHGTGIEPLFPLWRRDTDELASEMLRSGVVAHLTCVDPRRLPKDFAGWRWDQRLLSELPETADPCGENGEFHTFVSDGPGFAQPIDVQIGEVIERDGFVFADVVAAGESV